VGLITAGAGVVALGVGTYFGIQAKSKNDQSNTSGCSGNACNDNGYSTREDALSASTWAFAIRGVLAAGGVTLWLLAPRAATAPRIGTTAFAHGSGLAFEEPCF